MKDIRESYNSRVINFGYKETISTGWNNKTVLYLSYLKVVRIDISHGVFLDDYRVHQVYNNTATTLHGVMVSYNARLDADL